MAGTSRNICAIVLTIAALIGATGVARGQTHWQSVTQPGGYGVAKVDLAGAVLGFAVTCERGTPVMAVRLARQPSRSPAAMRLSGGATATLALIRNGATDVWVAAIRDPAVLDALASAPVTLTIGDASAVIPNDGAADAMRGALASCYRPTPAAAPPPATSAGVSPADAAAIRGILHEVYAWHDHGLGNKYWPPYTPSLAAMMAKCTDLADRLGKKDSTAAFGSCNDDYDRFCQCQDFDNNNIAGTMTVGLRAVRPGIIDADVKFWLFADDHTLTPLTFRFVHTAGGWKIDDLLRPGDGGQLESAERDGFSAGIADMSKQLKLPPWAAPPPETPIKS
ncbi:DUF3828 domain-containing protein [Sphingomonas koreensis]|nr:DUF3828 domain-containing protein [Sphingomonas koreensis]